MPRFLSLALCFTLLQSGFGLLQPAAVAQSDAMVELYGEGVHRYFAHDFAGADQVLSTVVDSGSEDARALFFRGLAREAAGYGGEMDFENAARLEAEGKRVVDVSAALTRVQGHLRTKIENARRDARIAVKQQQLMLEQARQLLNESGAGAAANVAPPRDNSTPIPSEIVPSSESAVTPAAPSALEPSDIADPFGDDPATPPADALPVMPDAPQPSSPDPFGTPPAEVPAGGDPFAPAAGGDNPFGL